MSNNENNQMQPLSPEVIQRFENHMPLLERVVSQLLTTGGAASVRDLVFLGASVLLRASAEWTENCGLSFKEYAEVTLTGELLHHMHYPVPVLRLPTELMPFQARLNATAQSLAAMHPAPPQLQMPSYHAMQVRHPSAMGNPYMQQMNPMALALPGEFYQPQLASAAPAGPNPAQFIWGLIKKRLPLIIALVIATEVGIATYTVNSPKTWVAHSTINTGIGGKDLMGGGGDWFTQGTVVANITELLKSRTVLENTIKELGLKTTTEDLAKRITIAKMGQAGFLKVEAEAENAQAASALVNALVREFMRYYAGSQSQDARSTKSFFESQVKGAEKKLRESEVKLRRFKGDVVPEMLEGVPARVGDLIAQRDEASRNLAASSAALSVVQHELNSIRRDPLLSQRIINSGGMVTATEKMRDLQMNLSDAKEIYGKDSPVVKSLENQLSRAKSQLRTTAVEATEQNPALADASARVVTLRADVAMNRARLGSLNAAIARMKPEARSASASQVTYEQLQREVKIAETQYLELSQKYGQSNLVAQGAANLAVSVVDPAIPPTEPLSSKLALKLVLGFLLSFGLGVFMSYLISLREKDVVEAGAEAEAAKTAGRATARNAAA